MVLAVSVVSVLHSGSLRAIIRSLVVVDLPRLRDAPSISTLVRFTEGFHVVRLHTCQKRRTQFSI